MSDQGGFTSGDPLAGGTSKPDRRAGTDAFGNPLPAPPQAPVSPPAPAPAPGGYGGSPVPPGAFATPAPDPFGSPAAGGQWRLASWGKRAVGAIIDGVVIAVIAGILFVPLTAVGISVDTEGGFFALVIAFLLYLLVLGLAALLYQPLMLWKTNGQTLGKMAMGIRVVKADKTAMDLGTAVVREVVLKSIAVGFVASWTFGIAYLLDWFWPLIDDQNRALHDFLIDTRVVDA